MTFHLENEFRECPEFITLLHQDEFCRELWTAFANISWQKVRDPQLSDSDNLINILLDEPMDRTWKTSLKSMADIIAEMRNDFHGKNENYSDWYCSNMQIVRGCLMQQTDVGFVSNRVKVILAIMGWKPVEDLEYLAVNC